jgi:hypothetical protein
MVHVDDGQEEIAIGAETEKIPVPRLANLPSN